MPRKAEQSIYFRVTGFIFLLILGVVSTVGSGGGGGGGGGGQDETPPTVTAGFPQDAQTDVGLNTNVTAIFSEAMNSVTIDTPASTFTLEDDIGTPVAGTVSYAGITATFTPSASLASNTSYTANVTTDAQDLAGNALASELSWTFTTGTDGTSPTVNPGIPSSGQTDVATDTTVTAVFSEPMDNSTINTSTFTLEDDSATSVPGVVSYAGVTATFTPDASLVNNMTYTAKVTTGARDSSGNPIASLSSWSFTVIPITIEVSWNANPETAVNRGGGGYKLYYSSNSGFDPADIGVTEVDVPFVSGPTAPTSVQIEVGPGTYYFRVAAYSSLNAPGTTGGSISLAAPQFSLTVP